MANKETKYVVGKMDGKEVRVPEGTMILEAAKICRH